MIYRNFFLAIVLAGCLAAVVPSQAADPIALEAQSISVSRYTLPGNGSVNTWIVEGPDGVVLVDFQRDVDSANAAIEQAKKIRKPVKALLLTHAHPDHIGGIQAFKLAFPEAPLYATRRTADEIRSDSHGYQRLTKKILKEKAPATYPNPDRILKDRDRIQVAGLVFEVREWGPSESESATIYFIPSNGALFSGDIVANRVTNFFLEGRTGLWLEQLSAMKIAYGSAITVYPGHGASGDFGELVKDSTAYLEAFRAAVRAEITATDGKLKEMSPDGAKRVLERIEHQFPDHPMVAAIPNLTELNATAVAKELTHEQTAVSPRP